MCHDLQLVRSNLKENPKLSHVRPSQRQTVCTSRPIKALNTAHTATNPTISS